eukprot:GHVP01043975.1.p1 GENE.GHVP01043975.1~~GHVP01043975.1.p1  ORF type:complete len:142 (+),score=17.39 GHVP01043975.1:232-657(+)
MDCGDQDLFKEFFSTSASNFMIEDESIYFSLLPDSVKNYPLQEEDLNKKSFSDGDARMESKSARNKIKKVVVESKNKSIKEKRCVNCFTVSSPTWRRRKGTREILCNPCGLHEMIYGASRDFLIDEDGNRHVKRRSRAKKE